MCRLILISALILFGCEKQSPPPVAIGESEPAATGVEVDTYQLSSVIWELGRKATFDALEEVAALDSAIQVLLSQPTNESLEEARHQWQTSLDAFYRAQPFLLLGVDTGPVAKNATVAHWPFYPGFIDSYGQYRDSGIVNAIDTPLNLSVVRQYHQQYEASELLLGFYPIAYLLWSEYEPRPIDEFFAVMSAPATLNDEAIKVTELPQNRRRQLLRLQSEWLLIDSKTLYDTWEAKHSDETLLPQQRLRMITDSLLLSLESILLQHGEGSSLPRRFIQQHRTGMLTLLSSIQAYYFDTGLADFWLIPEERILAQQLLTDLQVIEGDLASDKLEMLIQLLTPDAPQAMTTKAALTENAQVNDTP